MWQSRFVTDVTGTAAPPGAKEELGSSKGRGNCSFLQGKPRQVKAQGFQVIPDF